MLCRSLGTFSLHEFLAAAAHSGLLRVTTWSHRDAVVQWKFRIRIQVLFMNSIHMRVWVAPRRSCKPSAHNTCAMNVIQGRVCGRKFIVVHVVWDIQRCTQLTTMSKTKDLCAHLKPSCAEEGSHTHTHTHTRFTTHITAGNYARVRIHLDMKMVGLPQQISKTFGPPQNGATHTRAQQRRRYQYLLRRGKFRQAKLSTNSVSPVREAVPPGREVWRGLRPHREAGMQK